TLPGFRHDVCSAIHPLAVASPFFRSLDLQRVGLEWVQPPLPLTHPLASGDVAVLERSVAATAARLGRDGPAYTNLVQPLVARMEALLADVLRPMRIPSHPVLMARFGALALRSCRAIVDGRFAGAQARALFAGCGAHSTVPLERLGTAAFALVLLLAGHAFGLPRAPGGGPGGGRAAPPPPAPVRRGGTPRRRGGRCRSCKRPGRCSSTPRLVRRSRSRATSCLPHPATASSASATGRGSSRSTGLSTRPSPGVTRNAGGARPSTSATRSRPSPPRRSIHGRAASPRGRSSSSRSRASSTKPAHRRGGT